MENAERFVELVDRASAAPIAEVETARSITDTAPGVEFSGRAERLRKETITLRLRALSSSLRSCAARHSLILLSQ